MDGACACAGREVVSTDAAPAAVGPYSQAIKLGGTLYVSGQVPLVPGVQPLPHHVFVHMIRVTPRNSAVLSCLGPSSAFIFHPRPAKLIRDWPRLKLFRAAQCWTARGQTGHYRAGVNGCSLTSQAYCCH